MHPCCMLSVLAETPELLCVVCAGSNPECCVLSVTCIFMLSSLVLAEVKLSM